MKSVDVDMIDQKWKEVIHTELESLTKHKVFGRVVQISENIKPVGYKRIFVQKINENNEIQSSTCSTKSSAGTYN